MVVKVCLVLDAGILTVAVVSKPYDFEGSKRMQYAEEGIEALSEWVDSLIVIPNEKLSEVYGGDNSIFSSFDNANDVLRGAVKGIAEIITIRGFINVDFADVRTVMSGRGKAMMGSGVSSGANRAEEAVNAALSSPLLENIDLNNASGVLVNITAGADLSSKEFSAIGDKVKEIADDSATIIIGCIKEEDNLGDLRVTIVATGFDTAYDSQLSGEGSAISENPNNSNVTSDLPGLTEGLNDSANNASNFSSEVLPDADSDNLDVPAFLRQQAD